MWHWILDGPIIACVSLSLFFSSFFTCRFFGTLFLYRYSCIIIIALSLLTLTLSPSLSPLSFSSSPFECHIENGKWFDWPDKPEFILPPIVRSTRNGIQRQIYPSASGTNNLLAGDDDDATGNEDSRGDSLSTSSLTVSGDANNDKLLHNSLAQFNFKNNFYPNSIGQVNYTNVKSNRRAKKNNLITIDAVDGDDELEITLATKANPSQVTYFWSKVNFEPIDATAAVLTASASPTSDSSDLLLEEKAVVKSNLLNDSPERSGLTLRSNQPATGVVNDVPLTNGPRIVLSGGSLLIKSLNKQVDEGTYSVVASNIQGSTNVSFHLNILGKNS